MKKSNIITYALIATMLCVGITAKLVLPESSKPSVSIPSQPEQEAIDPEPEPEPIPDDISIRFTAVGDNLIHDVIYMQAKERATDGGYDFDYAYENILHLIPGDAVNFVNQETVLASEVYPLSNYPMFNSPTQVGDKLVNMGFTVINHANNHMFDKWEKGLLATLDYWDTQPVTAMGAWRNEEAMQQPIVVDKDGVRIGFVPVTQHTNGISLTKDSQMRYLLSADTESIKAQVALTQANSDFTIVSLHWGEENVFYTTGAQDALAQELADMGVNLVLGHHSHTVAPMKWVEGVGGNQTLVVYSLGNFISAMADKQNMLGAVLDMEIVKNGATSKAYIRDARLIPIVTHYEPRYRNLRLYPLAEYTDELAAAHGVRGKHPDFSVTYLTSTFQKTIPEEFRN